MVYLFGVLGFFFGFLGGLGILNFLLRGVSKEDLLNDPYIKLKYGLMCWGVAAAGAYVFVRIYYRVFI